MELIIWIGIVICISQSAMFSGLNLAFFNISKLRLELEMSKNNPQAFPIAKLREDSNFLLSSILWGNVSVNVLLTLLSGSVLTGASAFLFSTFVITIVGEIIPQSYLSRNAMKAASFLSPVIRFYQVLLYPLAKPTAFVLNKWLGKEAVQYVQEDDMISLIKLEMKNEDKTDLSKIEGQGLINIMNFDKVSLEEIGTEIAPENIFTFSSSDGHLQLPESGSEAIKEFELKLKSTTSEWIVLTDESHQPQLVMKAFEIFKDLYTKNDIDLSDYAVKPLLFESGNQTFLNVLESINEYKDVLPGGGKTVAIYWSDQNRRIITNQDTIKLIAKDMFTNN